MARYDLSEAEWRLVEPPLPPAERGPRRVDDRRVVNAIFYVLRTGSPCRLAMVRVMSVVPSRYCGPFLTAGDEPDRSVLEGLNTTTVLDAMPAAAAARGEEHLERRLLP